MKENHIQYQSVPFTIEGYLIVYIRKLLKTKLKGPFELYIIDIT
jgi:hypothetical protein